MTDFPATKKVALEARAWGDETRTYAKLDELHSDPANARLHSPRNIDAIVASLREYGQQSPIVIAEDGKVIAGNGRLEAARKLGLEELWVVQTDLSEMKRLGFAIADNRTAELAEWDEEVLASLLETARDHPELDLESTGWTEKEAERFWDAMVTDGEGAQGPEPAPTAADEAQRRWQVQTGDLFQIGPHRLLCGDSSSEGDLDRLLDGIEVGCVLTDPPYGINLDTDYSSLLGSKNSLLVKQGKKRDIAHTYRKVANDDRDFDASFLRSKLTCKEQFWFGANYFRRTLSDSDMDGSWLVWDKRPSGWNEGGEGIDDVIGSGFELVWSANSHQQRVLRHQWSGFTARNPELERAHPTEKPVKLLRELLSRWAPDGCAVVDPFGGSGTTMLAAHHEKRSGHLIEMDPAYCAVILERMSALGLVPEKVEP